MQSAMLLRSLIALLLLSYSSLIPVCTAEINRGSFPPGFVFGTASSAFQHEGAVKEEGRGLSIWDTFSHTFGKVADFSNADVAVDQYHRYDEDIKLMKDMNLDAYRFSISWPRIFPNGTGQINQAAVEHYNDLIDALLAHQIQPYVTLYHWDLPQSLHDKYNGWLDSQIIEDFTKFADTCFGLFGDRVKHWITFNEPHTFAVQGYDSGLHAPGRCSIALHLFCKEGNSSTEPYTVAHHTLLAHASAVDVYRRSYQRKQRGSIGISLDVIWFEPASNSTADSRAAVRAQDFQLGWFLEPLVRGDYPKNMRDRVGSRLPKFSASESSRITGSFDFIGINHYTTFYAMEDSSNIVNFLLRDTLADSGAITLPFRNGKEIGERANSIWLYIYPEGIRKLMNYIKKNYGNPPVIITENGMDDGNNAFITRETTLKDEKRIGYHRGYLGNLLDAINDGCDVRGYFVWSLLDNWEWNAGYSSRFGLYYVDYKHNLTRYPKDSVLWFKIFLKN